MCTQTEIKVHAHCTDMVSWQSFFWSAHVSPVCMQYYLFLCAHPCSGSLHFPSVLMCVCVCGRLVGLVVKASTSRADPGFKSCFRRDFSGSSHTDDFKIGTQVATLPGAWRYRVSAGTGHPGVSILWLGEVESLVCNFYLSVAARKIIWADPSLRYTSMLLGR